MCHRIQSAFATAPLKGEGLVIMWRLATCVLKTWLRDDYGAQAFRTTASDGPQWQSIGKRIPTDLNAGEVLEELAVNP